MDDWKVGDAANEKIGYAVVAPSVETGKCIGAKAESTTCDVLIRFRTKIASAVKDWVAKLINHEPVPYAKRKETDLGCGCFCCCIN